MGCWLNAKESFRGLRNSFLPKFTFATLSVALLVATGCQTTPAPPPGSADQPPPGEVTLRAGDTVRVTFPGTPNLNTPGQQIRPDGKITLPLLNEVSVAGMTPGQLEKELLARYSDQLVSKQVVVAVESASFVVYVNGAVLRPGPVKSNRPLTVLEAIMEGGGYDRTKANLKKVKVTRQEGGGFKLYTVNVEKQLKGQAPPFYLKPSDVVDVPEKFTIF